MPANLINISILILAWTGFFSIHSILASISAKEAIHKRFPHFSPYYRLIYNISSLILLIPIFLFSHSINSPTLWQWQGTMKVFSTIVLLLAAGAFLFTLRYYDSSEFIGTKQIGAKDKESKGEDLFTLSPLHRYVRHPWYFLAISIIWTRDMNLVFFVTATMVTSYFIIGSKLEERKLIHYYGEKYERYISAVPGIFPLPWRHITKKEAEDLIKL